MLSNSVMPPPEGPTPLTSRILLDVLKSSPHIETLELRGASCKPSSAPGLPVSSDQLINLPNLRHLLLSDIPQAFLHQVICSLRADNLNLLLVKSHEDGEDHGRETLHHLVTDPPGGTSMLAGVLKNLTRDPEPPEEEDDMYKTIATISAGWPLSVDYDEGKPVEVSIDSLNFDWSSLRIFQSIPLPVELMVYDGIADMLGPDCRVFTSFPSLTSLQIYCDAPETVAVIAKLREELSTEAVAFPCPKLAEIQLDDDFDHWSESEEAGVTSCLSLFLDDLEDSGVLECGVPVVFAKDGEMSWEFDRESESFVEVSKR